MNQEIIESVARAICDETLTEYNDDPKRYDVIARTAITAYQQAVAKDAVAWQSRFRLTNGDCTDWMTGRAVVYDGYLGSFEERPLFAAPPAPAVRVKALEWEKRNERNFFATTIVGEYQIQGVTDNSRYRLYFCGDPIAPSLGYYYEFEEAKAAAQERNDTLVLSALEDAPAQAIHTGFKLVPIEPTEAMLDALRARGCWMGADTYTALINAAPEAKP